MSNTPNFVITQDPETAEKLKIEGLTLFQETDGKYVFINDRPIQHYDGKKLIFTNQLFI